MNLSSGDSRSRCALLRRTIPTIVSISLIGCANIEQPTRQDQIAIAGSIPRLITVDDARQYLASIEWKIERDENNLRAAEGLSSIGTAGGGFTALAGSALRFSSNLIVRASLVGAASLGFGQALAVPAQLDVLTRARTALKCVDAQAVSAMPILRKLQDSLLPVLKARDDLAAEIARAKAANRDHSLDLAIEQAQRNVEYADIFIGARATASEAVAESVRLAADNILIITNDQLNHAHAQPEAFQQAVATIKVPTTTPKGPTPATLTPPPPQTGGGVKLEYFRGQHLDDALQAKSAALNLAMQAYTPPTPQSPVVNSATCQMAGVVLTFTPDGEIVVKPGTSYDLTITGGVPQWSWEGSPSPGVTVEVISSNHLRIAAAANAADTPDNVRYGLVFTAAGVPEAHVVSLRVKK